MCSCGVHETTAVSHRVLSFEVMVLTGAKSFKIELIIDPTFFLLNVTNAKLKVAPSYQNAATIARGIRPFAQDIIKTEGLWKVPVTTPLTRLVSTKSQWTILAAVDSNCSILNITNITTKGLWRPGCLTNASSIALSTCIRLT